MANKIYGAEESSAIFTETGGNVTFTPKNIATNSGRVSNQHDRGVGSKARGYRWYAQTKFATAAAIGMCVEVWIVRGYGSTGAVRDGNISQTDANVSSVDKRRNCLWIGNIACDVAADATQTFYASGEFYTPARFLQVYFVNVSGVTLTNTAGDHIFTLEPMADEIQ